MIEFGNADLVRTYVAANRPTPATSSLIVPTKAEAAREIKKFSTKRPKPASVEESAASLVHQEASRELARLLARPLAASKFAEAQAATEPPESEDDPDCIDLVSLRKNGGGKRTYPSVGAQREDGSFLLYPARDHMVFGPPEAAKSLWVLLHLLQAIRTPMPADGCTHGFRFAAGYERTPEYCEHELIYPFGVYVHFEETTADETLSRLVALGATDEELARIRFVNTARPVTKARLDRIIARSLPLCFVLLDGVKAACGMLGENVEKPESVAAYRAAFVSYPTSIGACVVSIHHPVKADSERNSRYAYGNSAWLEQVRGATFKIEPASDPIMRGHRGWSNVWVVKDTPGGVRESAILDERRGDQWASVGGFGLDDTREREDRTSWRMTVPKPLDGSAEQVKVAKLCDDIEAVLKDEPNYECASKAALERLLKASGRRFDKNLTKDAIDEMVLRKRLIRNRTSLHLPYDVEDGHLSVVTSGDAADDMEGVA